MGRGVLEQLDLIESASEDAAFLHHDGSNGGFFRFISPGGLAQRFAHEIVVALEIDYGVSHSWCRIWISKCSSGLRVALKSQTNPKYQIARGARSADWGSKFGI